MVVKTFIGTGMALLWSNYGIERIKNEKQEVFLSEQKSKKHTISLVITLIVMLGIVIVAALLIQLIYSTEPVAQREAAIKRTAMLVEVDRVERGTYAPQISGLGEVQAAQDVILSPRVSGRVIEIGENFIPGGFVKKGEVLLKIDPSDYLNAVKVAESVLQQARSDLSIELGRQDVAKREYNLLNKDLTASNKALVLREPQLASARAAVLSAEADLAQARLELVRTTIKADFDGHILSRNVNVGSQVSENTELARILGVHEYWVMVTVPLSKVERIVFPESEGEAGASVTLLNRTSWPEGASRHGEVKRLIGALDDQTRLARVLVSVQDPLARDLSAGSPRLIVGSIVQAQISGAPLKNVVRINRDYLREGDRVWVMERGRLAIRDAQVVFKDKDHAYLSRGLDDGDMLVTSNLATVAEGIELRVEEPRSGGQDVRPPE